MYLYNDLTQSYITVRSIMIPLNWTSFFENHSSRSNLFLKVIKMKDEEDTKFTKLFVGGIPYHTPDETLKEYFEQFDDIVEAVIIRERNSQRSKGYGFVSYLSLPYFQR